MIDFTENNGADAEFEAAFHKGYLDGKTANLIQKRTETANSSNLERNLALSSKLEAMRKVMGDLYTDIYKFGWHKGADMGRKLDSPGMISLRSEIAQNGAPDMAEAVWTQFDKILKSFLNKSFLNAENNDCIEEQKRTYAAFNTLRANAAKIIKDEKIVQKHCIEKLKEAFEIAFETVENPLEADWIIFKELKKEGRKMFRELPEAYNEGYSNALESGMRNAIKLKAVKTPSLVDNFYNALLAAISDKANPDYLKGYYDAGKMLGDINQNDSNASESDLKMSLQQLPSFVRKRLLDVIEEEYKEFAEINPDESGTEQFMEYQDKKNNYRNILSSFRESISDRVENMSMDEFLKIQLKSIVTELKDITSDMPNRTAEFFEKKIEHSWIEIIENYKKGFETAHTVELNEILDKRGGTSTISQGVYNFLNAQNSITSEVNIEGGYAENIDFPL